MKTAMPLTMSSKWTLTSAVGTASFKGASPGSSPPLVYLSLEGKEVIFI